MWGLSGNRVSKYVHVKPHEALNCGVFLRTNRGGPDVCFLSLQGRDRDQKTWELNHASLQCRRRFRIAIYIDFNEIGLMKRDSLNSSALS